MVLSGLGSTSATSGLPSFVALLGTDPLAWPFSLPFSPTLLSAIEYRHYTCKKKIVQHELERNNSHMTAECLSGPL